MVEVLEAMAELKNKEKNKLLPGVSYLGCDGFSAG